MLWYGHSILKIMKDEKLGQEPAFATQHAIADANNPAFKLGKSGMSKRFYAACAAMQGMIANPHIVRPDPRSGTLSDQYRSFISVAYEYADELLKQENE